MSRPSDRMPLDRALALPAQGRCRTNAYRSLPTFTRLMQWVDASSGCWLWTGDKAKKGYGRLKIEGKRVYAHRAMWEEKVGAIPAGQLVCHTCDNPSCVRPDHLFLGTQFDNMGDASAKGRCNPWNRGITHCRHGHEFSGENLLVSGGQRCCRACIKARKTAKKGRDELSSSQGVAA